MNEPPAHHLTQKEQHALELAQQGLSERIIALELNISRSAVRDRLENARRKLANQEPT